MYADYGEAKIENDILKGDYKQNDIFFFVIKANWKFEKSAISKHDKFRIYGLYSGTQSLK